ncbi:MAG: acetyl-CoA carboxylase biotin carboxyl carrier protein [Acidobacteriaceae bacterium]
MKVEVQEGMTATGSNDLQELKELVEFLKANGIAEFEMERPDLKVGLRFASEANQAALTVGASAASAGTQASGGMDALQLATLLSALRGGAAPAAPSVAAQETVSIAAVAAPTSAAQTPPAEADPWAGAHIVRSPIVGTFYDTPSPEAPPYVQVGDTVAVGKVLCIVEAMKLMNEIESDAAGTIAHVFVKRGQPVEYGQPLFAIK